MTPLRVLFLGTAEIACPTLRALHQHPDFRVVGVVTQPDKPAGRHLRPHPSPVKQLALELHLPVWQPARVRDAEFLETARALAPDLGAVAAYGQLLPPALLALPRLGCVNLHASLLPRHRGAAPIQWALFQGDPETGVTIMQMDEGLDTGPILAQARIPILPEDNAGTLHDRLAELGAELFVSTVREFAAGRLEPRPQPAEGVSYAPKIKKEDARLDWQQPARVLWNRIRAFTPWPGAFCFVGDDAGQQRLKIWRTEVVATTASARPGEILQADKHGLLVACGQDALRITALQPEGGRWLSVAEFLPGHPLRPGQHLL